MNKAIEKGLFSNLTVGEIYEELSEVDQVKNATITEVTVRQKQRMIAYYLRLRGACRLRNIMQVLEIPFHELCKITKHEWFVFDVHGIQLSQKGQRELDL